jgi:MFS family permease
VRVSRLGATRIGEPVKESREAQVAGTPLTYPARVTFFRDLRTLLRYGGFRRLFSVRLLSQFADGVFQVALVSSVLFSPERAPNAGAIAAGFATILLPFSVLGPFVGVFLDRWPRRMTLVISNLVRALLLVVVALLVGHDSVGPAFFVLVLAAFSVNRFLLAGLSASLPHVVDRDLLVTANSVVPTCGSIAYLSGLGAGGLLHAVTDSDPAVIATAAVLYLLSSGVAYLLPFLGPDLEEVGAEVREALGNVAKGLVDAARHLPRLARLALTVVTAARLPYGMMIVGLVLISRNHLVPGNPVGGMAGAGLAVAASGVGFGAAAIVTPTMTGRFGLRRYIAGLALLGMVMQIFPLALFVSWAIAVSAFGLGLVTQGIKICVDTTLQRVVGDVFLGRVFSIYDVLLNVALVVATVIAALVMPADGRSIAVLAGASVWYLAIAVAVARYWPRRADRLVTERVH